MKKIFLQTQIWARNGNTFYVDLFTKYVLKYVKEMLPELKDYPVEFHIYADLKSTVEITPHLLPIFHIPILCYPLEEISPDSLFEQRIFGDSGFAIYSREADCKFHCMSRAVEEDAAIIFVDPNQYVSTGSWGYMLNQIEQGYDACVMKALRCNENIINFLGDRDKKTFLFTALCHLHDVEKPWEVEEIINKTDMCLPCAIYKKLYWKETDIFEGFICHGLHMAIPMVYPKKQGTREGFSPDHCFHTGWGLDKIKVIDDSDHALFVEVCRKNFGTNKEHFEADSLENRLKFIFQKDCFTLQNLKNALTPIFIHKSENKEDFACDQNIINLIQGEITQRESNH